MANRPTPRLCPYCGRDLTGLLSGRDFNRDHVVARQFFPEPRPKDLGQIIANSCMTCNTSFKKDEEYFVATYSAHLAERGGTANVIFEQVKRGLPKNVGQRNAVGRGIRTVETRTNSGLYLQQKVIEIDTKRIDMIVRKWVRGLHLITRGVVLDANVPIQIANFDPPHALADHWPNVKQGASWPDKFEYWYSSNEVEPLQTRWSFLLWGVMGIFALTNDTIGMAVPGVIKGPNGEFWSEHP